MRRHKGKLTENIERNKKRHAKRLKSAHDLQEPCGNSRFLSAFFDILCGLVTAFLLLFYLLWLLHSMSTRKEEDDQKRNASLETHPPPKFVAPDMVEIIRWGHNGSEVKIPVKKLHLAHQDEHMKGYRNTGFNQYVSDRISMRRELPDVRDPRCLEINSINLDELGGSSASVIVVFRDEPWTTLLRTVYSIVDRSQPEVLEEIILVDDGSTLDILQYPRLEHYLSVLKKVRIIRLTKQGMAKARMEGAKQAKGEFIVFLHARCECTQGWLLPLVIQIKQDEGAIAVPVVDKIDPDTFEYIPQSLSQSRIGTFTWELRTTQRYLPNPPLYLDESVTNPVISDGIFGMQKTYFLKLGGIDTIFSDNEVGNIEFSFKAWLCGGMINLVPCSHIGHVSVSSYSHWEQELDYATAVRERKLMAELWMGNYKDFVNERLPNLRNAVKGDQSYRWRHNQLREQMQCKNFSWYMHEIEPSMRLNGHIIHRGKLLHVQLNTTVLALAVTGNDDIFLQEWYQSNLSIWYLMDNGQLKTANNTCLIASVSPKMELDLNENGDIQNPSLSQFRARQFESQPDKDFDRIEPNQDQTMPSSDQIHQDPSKNFLQFADVIKKINKTNISQSKSLEILFSDLKPNLNLHDKQADQLQLLVDQKSGKSRSSRASRDVLFFQQPKPVPAPPVHQLGLRPCYEVGKEGRWLLTENDTLQHISSSKCLEVHKATANFFVLRMEACDKRNPAQIWTFSGMKKR